MTREEFSALTEEEQTAYLETSAAAQETIDTLTAERDSLRESEAAAQDSLTEMRAELASTKKLNFTLARQVSNQVTTHPDDETIIHDMFKRG